MPGMPQGGPLHLEISFHFCYTVLYIHSSLMLFLNLISYLDMIIEIAWGSSKDQVWLWQSRESVERETNWDWSL